MKLAQGPIEKDIVVNDASAPSVSFGNTRAGIRPLALIKIRKETQICGARPRAGTSGLGKRRVKPETAIGAPGKAPNTSIFQQDASNAGPLERSVETKS